MPDHLDLSALGGKGPSSRGASSPLRPGSTSVGLGTGRGLGPPRTRATVQERIAAAQDAAAKKPR